MTVAALTELFLMNMSYSRSDTQEEDVIAEYSGILLHWLNEGYLRAVLRVSGRDAAQGLTPLTAEDDEPVLLCEGLHPRLADYAAARGQEMRGNAGAAAALYAAFERGLAEEAVQNGYAYSGWARL